MRAGFDPAAVDAFRAAFEAARELGLPEEAARAVMELTFSRQMRGIPGAAAPELPGMIADALALVGDAHPLPRAQLRASAVMALHLAGRQAEAVEQAEANLHQARETGDERSVLAALMVNNVYTEPSTMLTRVAEAYELSLRVGDTWQRLGFASGMVRAQVLVGDVPAAAEWVERIREENARARSEFYRFMLANLDCMVALVRGDFDEAERQAALGAELLADRTDFVSGVYGLQMYTVRLEQGRLGEVVAVLRMAARAEGASGLWGPGLAALYAHVGMLDEARSTFDELAADGFAAIPRDAMWSTSLHFLAEVCIALGDVGRAPLLDGELAVHAGHTLGTAWSVCFGPADRLRGALSALQGHTDEARRRFGDALAIAGRSGSPVWLARVQHDWATTLGERPDLLEQAHVDGSTAGHA